MWPGHCPTLRCGSYPSELHKQHRRTAGELGLSCPHLPTLHACGLHPHCHMLLWLQSVQARTQARIRLLHLLSNVHTITPAIGGIVGALSESVPSTSRIIAAIVQNQLLTQLPISISPRSESSWKSEARDVACIWLEAALHVLGNSMAWLHARLRAWFIPLRSSRTRILGCPGVTIPLTTATGQMGPETPTHHPGTEPGTSACVSRGAVPLS